MRFIIHVGLGHKPVSIHASLDEAMKEVRNTWLKPIGNHNIAQWWLSFQTAADGTIDSVWSKFPTRQMTDAEMVEKAESARTLRGWRKMAKESKTILGVTDYDQMEKHAIFPNGRVDSISIVREDRAIQGTFDAADEGNDTSHHAAQLRAMGVQI